ncbi:hypothetical protein ACFQJD_15675 [Haloplanus sp. GCM10025708]|uniref:hypothetical protein n=1 Tax=Haloferacaceae TaxID=1644056 RepID=UPI00360DE9B6
MLDERYRRLHEFIIGQAGDAYRAALHYDEDGVDTLFIREERATSGLEEAIPDVYDRAQETRALLREEKHPPLGPWLATTEIHGAGVLLHFPEAPDEGVIVSLDREAARRLSGFVDHCATILRTAPPEEHRPVSVD